MSDPTVKRLRLRKRLSRWAYEYASVDVVRWRGAHVVLRDRDGNLLMAQRCDGKCVSMRGGSGGGSRVTRWKGWSVDNWWAIEGYWVEAAGLDDDRGANGEE